MATGAIHERASQIEPATATSEVIPLLSDVVSDLDAQLDRLCRLSVAERSLVENGTYTTCAIEPLVRRCENTSHLTRIERTVYRLETRGLLEDDTFASDAQTNLNTARKAIHDAVLALNHTAMFYRELAEPGSTSLTLSDDPQPGCRISRAIGWLDRARSLLTPATLVADDTIIP